MKRSCLSSVAVTALFASGVAFACNDMKMTDDGDGYKATDRSLASTDRPATETAVLINPATVKQKSTAKQKSQGKPLTQGSGTLVKTGS